jgi:crotonobetainyl-CoA:carnitine CoA-transferase CaiB-like acyl-CoA transferase
VSSRKANEDALEADVSSWCASRGKFDIQSALIAAGVPAAAVQKPGERIDHDPDTEGFGLWPTVRHSKMGDVRVDGLPVHLSKTDWQIERGGPCLGEHTDQVLNELIGLSESEIAQLREEGVV